MKLSDAIRRGAKMRPQAFGVFFTPDGTGHTCALGAGAEGAGILGKCVNMNNLAPLGEKFGEFFYNTHQASPCGCIPLGWMVHNQIAHLNDIHKWSREAIAEWVEVVEKKLEAQNAASSDPVVSRELEVSALPVGVPAEAKV